MIMKSARKLSKEARKLMTLSSLVMVVVTLASLILAIMLLTMWKDKDVKQITNILIAIVVCQVISLIFSAVYIYETQINLCKPQSLPIWLGIMFRLVILMGSAKLIHILKRCNKNSNKMFEMFEEEYQFWRNIVAWTILAPAMCGFVLAVLAIISASATIAEEQELQNSGRR